MTQNSRNAVPPAHTHPHTHARAQTLYYKVNIKLTCIETLARVSLKLLLEDTLLEVRLLALFPLGLVRVAALFAICVRAIISLIISGVSKGPMGSNSIHGRAE